MVDNCTPGSSQTSDKESNDNIDLDQLVVSVDTENLSPDQVLRVKQVLGNWLHIFSKGPTDL